MHAESRLQNLRVLPRVDDVTVLESIPTRLLIVAWPAWTWSGIVDGMLAGMLGFATPRLETLKQELNNQSSV